ncbi:WG repeat-containing protein [Algoriphagus sp. C2-6-M1]|uniref:WG repeat-containing protein n=1 Tax=Algoriphagus persicinus TaxID=3108754 RepID=UPI002B3F9345|nr:WG repeat-containing protein [Algoriphagus sp. C2-6-M1]MEB2779803.1 WG repeat-containing protein [Algoriphagus sp. C2-6-M1]
MISSTGELVSDANWEEIKPFHQGLAIAKANGKYFLLNTFGAPLNTEGYDTIYRTIDGYFLVEKSMKSGLLNGEGEEVIPAEFEGLRREKKNFVIVQKDGLTGVINETGEIILPLAYEEILVDWENEQIFTKSRYVPTVIQIIEDPSKKNKKEAVSKVDSLKG